MVTGDTDNERTVLEFFRILSTGDLDAIRETLHDEVTWTPQVKDIPGAGTYHGKKGVVDDFLGPVRGMFAPGDPKTTVKTIVSRGSFVMCESEGKGKLQDGRTYDNRYAWALEVKDGKIFAIREYMDSHYVAKLFGME
jgi:uncharacterized protein